MRPTPPPGMAPWVRDTSASLARQQRALETLGAAPSNQRYAYSDSLTGVISSPPGATEGWGQLPEQTSPRVIAVCDTGQLRVTVSALITAVWDGVSAATATGIMRFAFQGEAEQFRGVPSKDLTGGGLIKTFAYVPGMIGVQHESASASKILKVSKGRYSIRSEFVYQHLTDGISISWSQCEITAESI